MNRVKLKVDIDNCAIDSNLFVASMSFNFVTTSFHRAPVNHDSLLFGNKSHMIFKISAPTFDLLIGRLVIARDRNRLTKNCLALLIITISMDLGLYQHDYNSKSNKFCISL